MWLMINRLMYNKNMFELSHLFQLVRREHIIAFSNYQWNVFYFEFLITKKKSFVLICESDMNYNTFMG